MARALRPFIRLSETLGSRYGALLVVLVFMLVIYSFATRQVILWILDLTVLAILGLGLRAVPVRRSVYIVMLTAGVAALVAGTLGNSLGVEAAYPFGIGLRAICLASLLWMIVSDVLSRNRVTMDAVLGVSCVYLLLAITWGCLYGVLEWVDPGCFGELHDPALSHRTRAEESDLIYFSMITLTTVGYGDIVPVTPPARTLAALEGLVAQLFVAIVIARFVALEITHRARESA